MWRKIATVAVGFVLLSTKLGSKEICEPLYHESYNAILLAEGSIQMERWQDRTIYSIDKIRLIPNPQARAYKELKPDRSYFVWLYRTAPKDTKHSVVGIGGHLLPAEASEKGDLSALIAYWVTTSKLVVISTDECVAQILSPLEGRWIGIEIVEG